VDISEIENREHKEITKLQNRDSRDNERLCTYYYIHITLGSWGRMCHTEVLHSGRGPGMGLRTEWEGSCLQPSKVTYLLVILTSENCPLETYYK